MRQDRERRIQQVRFRARVQRWEYRQRNLAKGTWHRLRRVLADAREAWIIDRDAADRLVAEGHVPEPAGLALEPPKRIFFVSEQRARELGTALQRTAVRLDPQMLSAECVALVRFDP